MRARSMYRLSVFLGQCLPCRSVRTSSRVSDESAGYREETVSGVVECLALFIPSIRWTGVPNKKKRWTGDIDFRGLDWIKCYGYMLLHLIAARHDLIGFAVWLVDRNYVSLTSKRTLSFRHFITYSFHSRLYPTGRTFSLGLSGMHFQIIRGVNGPTISRES